MALTTPRSEVISHPAPKQGHGTSRTWQRTIAGKRYSFTAILMPSGERRYAASRLDVPGKPGDFDVDAAARFDCYWHRVGFWTVPVALADKAAMQECRRLDHGTFVCPHLGKPWH
jgi:hypothetical protein